MANLKNNLEERINSKTPFTVMTYNDFLATDRDLCVKKYEIIYIHKEDFCYIKMSESEILYFTKNINLFNQKINCNDGSIYEYLNMSNTREFLEIQERERKIEREKIAKKELNKKNRRDIIAKREANKKNKKEITTKTEQKINSKL